MSLGTVKIFLFEKETQVSRGNVEDSVAYILLTPRFVVTGVQLEHNICISRRLTFRNFIVVRLGFLYAPPLNVIVSIDFRPPSFQLNLKYTHRWIKQFQIWLTRFCPYQLWSVANRWTSSHEVSCDTPGVIRPEMFQSFVYKTFVEQEITQVQRQVSLPCPFQIQIRATAK